MKRAAFISERKNLRFIVIGFLVVVILVSGFYLSSFNRVRNSERINKPIDQLPGQEIQSAEYKCEKGKNALEILLAKVPNVKYQESTFGKLVTEINGVKQGNSKYWLYSIDNKEATIGASSYICQDQEIIKWELK